MAGANAFLQGMQGGMGSMLQLMNYQDRKEERALDRQRLEEDRRMRSQDRLKADEDRLRNIEYQQENRQIAAEQRANTETWRNKEWNNRLSQQQRTNEIADEKLQMQRDEYQYQQERREEQDSIFRGQSLAMMMNAIDPADRGKFTREVFGLINKNPGVAGALNRGDVPEGGYKQITALKALPGDMIQPIVTVYDKDGKVVRKGDLTSNGASDGSDVPVGVKAQDLYGLLGSMPDVISGAELAAARLKKLGKDAPETFKNVSRKGMLINVGSSGKSKLVGYENKYKRSGSGKEKVLKFSNPEAGDYEEVVRLGDSTVVKREYDPESNSYYETPVTITQPGGAAAGSNLDAEVDKGVPGAASATAPAAQNPTPAAAPAPAPVAGVAPAQSQIPYINPNYNPADHYSGSMASMQQALMGPPINLRHRKMGFLKDYIEQKQLEQEAAK